MARVLRPRGTLLIANLTSFTTAGPDGGWQPDSDGRSHFCIDHYLDERAEWVRWRGIRVKNWHRPLCRYMTLLLGAGLTLTHFDEPRRTAALPRRPTEFSGSVVWSGKKPRAGTRAAEAMRTTSWISTGSSAGASRLLPT
jgi:hypothetical protein